MALQMRTTQLSGFSPNNRTYRCPLEGSFGVGASSSVVDGGDLLVEQGALVLVGLGCRDVVHPGNHVGLGREGHQRHSCVLRCHGEVGQHLADEPELALEVVGPYARGFVHQKDEVQTGAFLPQLADVLLERLSETLHLALSAFRQVAGRRRGRHLSGPSRLLPPLGLLDGRPG